jgi:hypothetical protein
MPALGYQRLAPTQVQEQSRRVHKTDVQPQFQKHALRKKEGAWWMRDAVPAFAWQLRLPTARALMQR